MKRRVKADRLTPAFPQQGALIRRLTDGVAPGFGHPSTAASPSQAKLCPSGTEPPSDVHQVSRAAKLISEISEYRTSLG